MKNHLSIRQAAGFGALTVLLFSGCVTFTKHAVPASRLPNQFAAPERSSLVPINFSVLAGNKPAEYRLDSDDILAITIPGVVPPDAKELPPIIMSVQQSLSQKYYPPNGTFITPGLGIPVTVQANGDLQLPLIPAIHARGLTQLQLAEEIRKAYITKGIVKEGNDQVNVSLIRGRVNRVLVLREDIPQPANVGVVVKGNAILHKRGSAEVIDLPVYESDVLHALATSGGLPGVDANNEVWILRKSILGENDAAQLKNLVDNGEDLINAVSQLPAHLEAIRIPLKLCPDQPIPFAPEDVLLQDGDIVYIEPRRNEYFYTGGLLPGGQIPMPRDEDLDVLEAVALAQGSVGGLGGTAAVSVLRAGAGVGNIVPPTRLLVLRKLPNGDQLPIRVDLAKAMHDPTERINIMAGDYIMMYYKPGEMTTNSVLNFFNFSWVYAGGN
ncbi:MAG: polysaccharide biosynthesis/export family protein [Planctomycetales bacterium]|nr:polysaccharide biosynthesis/export family protein [Planctomycetales bacterium]